MNTHTPQSTFSLSDACRAAGSVTPLADARERRAFLCWLGLVVTLAAATFYAAGWLAGAVVLAAGGVICGRLGGKTGRRRRTLWREPWPEKYEKVLRRRIPHYRCLDAAGRDLFRQRVKLLLGEVVFHGAGMKVTDGLRLRAAAAAVVPTLGFPEWEWPELKEIIFRPEGYENGVYQDGDGVVTEYEESGMVGIPGDMYGTMMLSSRDLRWEFAHPEEGLNVGMHEFAHLMVEGGLVLPMEDRERWRGLIKSESLRLGRGESLLDEYAFLNEDEFFAVASELFFTVPRRFRSWHGRLYGVLARCYRSDPAVWLDTGEPEPDRPPKRRRRRLLRRVRKG